MNDECHGRYNTGGEIKFKATMLTVHNIIWYTVEISKQITTLLIRKCLMLIVVWIAETYLEPEQTSKMNLFVNNKWLQRPIQSPV